jgi:DNA-binding NtrC family response regulator
MRQLFGVLSRVAQSDSPVVLLGETGTGKEVLARALHQHSARRDHPFVVFDCGAVAASLVGSELFGHLKGSFTGASADRKGAFLQADGGTLFLDEIGELPLELQPRLLRALEAGTVKRIGEDRYRSIDVRVVAATHRNLTEEVQAVRFRQDLFFRLAVAMVRIPPLRDRLEDLPGLAQRFVLEINRGKFELSPALLARLRAYHWPGNVRELRNVVARAMLGEDAMLMPEEAASAPRPAPTSEVSVELPFKEAKDRLVEAFTRDYLAALLERHGGHITRAAQAAGLARPYLHKLVVKYGLRVVEDP